MNDLDECDWEKNISLKGWLKAVVWSAGSLAMTVGLTVLAGWHAHLPRLVQINPALAPVQYNTALCILALGMALGAFALGRLRLMQALGSTVVIFSGLTLLEYALNTNLGIDELFFKSYITTETTSAGRMAPITGICLLQTGLALVLSGFRSRKRWWPLVVGLMASVVMALCAMAILEHVLKLPGAYGWGRLIRMAVLTAGSLEILGLGVFVIAWTRGRDGDERTPRWLPVPVALGLMVTTLLLWQALVAKQNFQVAKTTRANAENVQNQINTQMESRLHSLMRMDERWEFSGRPVRAAWEDDASHYLHDFPDLEAIEWLDASNLVRWIVPVAGNEDKLGVNLLREQRRRQAAETARRQRQPVVSRSVELFHGGRGFVVYTPLYLGTNFDGWLGGVFRAQQLFDNLLPERIAPDNGIAIHEDGTLLYQRTGSAPPARGEWTADSRIELSGTVWQVRVWPTPALLAQMDTPLPGVVLTAGLVLSVLFALAVRLMQVGRTQVVKLAETEGRLRQINDGLERRVRDRTAELESANASLQAALRQRTESEETIRQQASLFDQTYDGAIVWEWNGPITFWNRGAENLYGFSRAEAVGRVSHNLLRTRFPDGLAQLLATLEQQNQWDGELEHTTREGRTITVESRMTRVHEPGRVYVLEANRDITGRRRLELAAREKERHFQTMADSIPQLAWMAQADGFILWYNRRWYEYTGTTPQQMEGWGWQSVHDPRVLPKVMANWTEAIRSGQPFDMEFPLRGADGQFRTFLTRVQPLKDADGRVIEWFGTNTDVDELKRTEEKIQRLNAELEQRVTERTAELKRSNQELEQFAYVASHDMREPLRAVSGFAQILKRNCHAKLDEKDGELIGHIVDGAKRLSAIIDDLLALSQIVAPKQTHERIGLEQPLALALKNLSVALQERGATVAHDPLPTLPVDGAQMALLFQNLIGNAIKFCRDRPPEIHIGAARDADGFWKISVRDNGIGIEPKYFGRIFAIFQRLHTRDEYPGTGIGLAICQKIVERHGGRIWPETNAGAGTTFYFTLPETQRHLDEASPAKG